MAKLLESRCLAKMLNKPLSKKYIPLLGWTLLKQVMLKLMEPALLLEILWKHLPWLEFSRQVDQPTDLFELVQ
jgi:hypothetical protein